MRALACDVSGAELHNLCENPGYGNGPFCASTMRPDKPSSICALRAAHSTGTVLRNIYLLCASTYRTRLCNASATDRRHGPAGGDASGAATSALAARQDRRGAVLRKRRAQPRTPSAPAELDGVRGQLPLPRGRRVPRLGRRGSTRVSGGRDRRGALGRRAQSARARAHGRLRRAGVPAGPAARRVCARRPSVCLPRPGPRRLLSS